MSNSWNSYYGRVEQKNTEISAFLRFAEGNLTEESRVAAARYKSLAEAWRMATPRTMIELVRYRYSDNYMTSLLVLTGNLINTIEQYAVRPELRTLVRDLSCLLACRLGGMKDDKYYTEIEKLRAVRFGPHIYLNLVDGEIYRMVTGFPTFGKVLTTLIYVNDIHERIIALSRYNEINRISVSHELRKLIGNPFEDEPGGEAERNDKESIWVFK